MPNFRVFTDQASDLKTRIYGNDGTSDFVIKTDSTGVLAIQDNRSSITVDATDLDIRDLTNASDSILIYGQDGTTNRIVRTDTNGYVQIMHERRLFTDQSENVSTATAYATATSTEVAEQSQYTFVVWNTGSTNTATVKLELSPDNTNWLTDSSETEVGTSTNVALVGSKFMRYARIFYKSTTAGSDTSLTVW